LNSQVRSYDFVKNVYLKSSSRVSEADSSKNASDMLTFIFSLNFPLIQRRYDDLEIRRMASIDALGSRGCNLVLHNLSMPKHRSWRRGSESNEEALPTASLNALIYKGILTLVLQGFKQYLALHTTYRL